MSFCLKNFADSKKSATFAPGNAKQPTLDALFRRQLPQGAMLEWLKRHAWKACIRQKRIGGSNPPRSAK